MYQPNIPMIYVELEKQNPREMSRVVASGSAILGGVGNSTTCGGPNYAA